MKKLLAILMLSAITTTFSQDFKVPQNYELKTADDYAEYEEDVINCVDWLAATPINEATEKRKEAHAFLVIWMIGSPNVSVDLNGKIVDFNKQNDELTILFMGAYAKYCLENEELNPVEANLAALETSIAFYEKNREQMKKDKTAEKYIEMKKAGTLKAYVEKSL